MINGNHIYWREKLRLASVGDLERKNIRKFAKRGIPVTIVD